MRDVLARVNLRGFVSLWWDFFGCGSAAPCNSWLVFWRSFYSRAGRL